MAYHLSKIPLARYTCVVRRSFVSLLVIGLGLGGTVFAATQTPESASMNKAASCALNSNKNTGLAQSPLPQLQKLAEYEAVCAGSVTDTTMVFAPMPSSVNNATLLAQEMATTLGEFARNDMHPIVILEPATTEGLVNFREYQQGKYDDPMQTYFQKLKAQGITDTMMGTWVPFPEPNIPEWDDTTIKDTVANITKTITLQKKYFPASKASILLDSISYPPGNHAWKAGEYKSLVPYVADIPRGLVDSFGYQGFPWSPPQSEGGLSRVNLSASQFLQSGLAIEAAKKLGVSEVWLNTGSFGKSHANNPSRQVTVSPEKRNEILQTIITEAQKIQDAGFTTAIHVFAEDKSALSEGVDWSYWQTGAAESSPTTPVFKDFVAAARENGFDVWLFDTKH